MKYYWFVYKGKFDNIDTPFTSEHVSNRHPFIEIKENSDEQPDIMFCLINWKEITEEEFKLFNSLNE